MNKITKIIIVGIILILGLAGLASFLHSKNGTEAEIRIISTSFPGYDFARAITKDVNTTEVKMLLKPGMETHDFEPTPQDIKDIKNSDVFIYVGGESDEWIENALNDINTEKTKIIRLMDLVDVVEEETVEGMEEDKNSAENAGSAENARDGAEKENSGVKNVENNAEDEIEYDEHVWTSPVNAIKIVEKLKDEIIEIDNKNAENYAKNAENYMNELTEIDAEIRNVVKNAKRKEIIFGDRFPLVYFVKEYGLDYYAAFPGCAEQTEASAKTIAFLINKVKEDEVPVVLKIELSSGKIAETIAEETGAMVLEFNSAHNISKKDFEAGVTYAEIMKKNVEVLREALK